MQRSILLTLSLFVPLYLPACSKKDNSQTDQQEQSKNDSAEKSESTTKPVIATRPEQEKPEGLIPQFVEVTAAVGVDFQRYDDHRGQHRILEANGGGVAIFDFDCDGWLDLYFSNGCHLPLKENDHKHRGKLYRNRGDGTFDDVTERSGLIATGYGAGVAVGDYNHDGYPDLYINAYGSNSFWENNGDGTFTNVTNETGTDCQRWGSSVAFADLNRDGHLDLYLVNYVIASDDPPRLCPAPGSPDGYMQCSPTLFKASKDVILLSDGQGEFLDLTEQLGFTGEDGKGLGVCIFDRNQDGWPDVYVSNDGMPNFLYLNRGRVESEGQPVPLVLFEEVAGAEGVGVDFYGKAEASMGIAVGDINRDNFQDLLLTHFHAETNTLYVSAGADSFEDLTIGSGLEVTSPALLGFGTIFSDVTNNGWLDVFITNGHVDDFRWNSKKEPYAMPAEVFRSEQDGSFVNVSPWAGEFFKKEWVGRGLGNGDLDRDGDQDFVISHQGDRSVVLRNETPTENQSVIIRLIGTGTSNRDAIGARVEVVGADPPLMRELVAGQSFQSSCANEIHLGLGNAAEFVTLKVTWPSGETEEWQNVKPGYYTAIEKQGLHPLGLHSMVVQE